MLATLPVRHSKKHSTVMCNLSIVRLEYDGPYDAANTKSLDGMSRHLLSVHWPV